MLAVLAAGAFTVLYQSIDVPDPNADFETQTTYVYYADGKTELGKFATQNRDSITYDEMPQNMKDAVVAAENRSFWTDKGLDPRGILRAAFSNARGNSQQGASTITQQYVKILYLTQERSYKRKIKEAIVSLKLQRQQSKQQILEGYLNTIYFGRGAYGIEAAARRVLQQEGQGPHPPRGGGAGVGDQQPDPLRPGQRQGQPRRRCSSATSTSSPGWPRRAPSTRPRPRRPRSGCRSSRRSRPSRRTPARRASCST